MIDKKSAISNLVRSFTEIITILKCVIISITNSINPTIKERDMNAISISFIFIYIEMFYTLSSFYFYKNKNVFYYNLYARYNDYNEHLLLY